MWRGHSCPMPPSVPGMWDPAEIAFQGARFVSGHGLSRADKVTKIMGFSPCSVLDGK